MAMHAAQLLKQLEPAVRPLVAPSQRGVAQAALESQSFEQLLVSASKGAIHSGRQIEMAVDVQPPLDAEQLERLAAAADQAEAAGATRALMLIDGRGFVLDVAKRAVVAELSNQADACVLGIDAAVHVGKLNEAQVRVLNAPGSAMPPPAVLRQIQSSLATNPN